MAKQPFRVSQGVNAQRGGKKFVSPNASKVIAHAMDSDTDSLMRAATEEMAPDHEVGSVVGDSDDRSFTEAIPWGPAEHYRGEPQQAPAAPRNPFKLK